MKVLKLFYRLFNHHKIDEMQRTVDSYRERNEQLEKEVFEYKGYKLKYQVTKLYVEDDEALLELLDCASSKETAMDMLRNQSRQAQCATAQSGLNQYGGGGAFGLGGLGGSAYLSHFQ